MEKIPTLFVCTYDRQNCHITPEVNPACAWVLAGEGKAYPKYDGTACLVKNGKLFARYDAMRGKTPPLGAIPCQDPDPITGHWPHWVEVTADNPQYKWHWRCWDNWDYRGEKPKDGTYELIGPHFQGNPHGVPFDYFMEHEGNIFTELRVERSFEGIRNFLSTFNKEGIVFWHSDGRKAKIRRDHFGFAWPITSNPF